MKVTRTAKSFRGHMSNSKVLILSLIFAGSLSRVEAQESPSGEQTVAGSSGSPVVLQMGWRRGDPFYGPNFIELNAPCPGSSDKRCECHTEFPVTRSQEFAEYVASFRDEPVPVTYTVWYDKSGEPTSVRLASVGTWKRERFHVNDGLIGPRLKRNTDSSSSRTQAFRARSPGDCFSPLKKVAK